MNKYQEALDKLMSLPVEDISKAPTFCRVELGDYSEIGGVNIEECRETLQELIISNVQAPKVNVNDNNKPTRFYCGSCNLRLKKTWKCCPRCATKIDWGNDE